MEFILFGAGDYGRLMLKIIGKSKVAYFVDNRIQEENVMEIDGISVLPYESMRKIHSNYNIVITTNNAQYVFEISRQLTRDNIPFIFMDEIAREKLDDDIDAYKKLNTRSSFDYEENSTLFFPYEKYQSAGTVNAYFWQDLWGAKHVFDKHPAVHCDIGSRIDGFIAHLLSFGQKVQMLDIRPMDVLIPGVEFVQCDATNMNTIADESLESLSALCSLEHFGLGRYGDPINPEACFQCFSAIQRKMKKGGDVYISVPIGKEHLEFHAHRVFYASTLVDNFDNMELLEFSVIHRNGIEKCIDDIHKYDEDSGGVGLFHFCKE